MCGSTRGRQGCGFLGISGSGLLRVGVALGTLPSSLKIGMRPLSAYVRRLLPGRRSCVWRALRRLLTRHGAAPDETSSRHARDGFEVEPAAPNLMRGMQLVSAFRF